MKTNTKTSALVECAVMVALATVLSLIKVYQMPLGGSVTALSMLPVCLFSLRWGTGWGLLCGLLHALVQMGLDLGAVVGWGLTPVALIGCIVLDYLLAFTLLGLAGSFRQKGKWGMILGISLALFLRFACHLASGTLIFDIWLPEDWANPFWYSVCYNGSFMLPELVLTVIGAFGLVKVPAVLKKGS